MLYVFKAFSVIPFEVVVYIIVFCQNATTPYTGGILLKTIIFFSDPEIVNLHGERLLTAFLSPLLSTLNLCPTVCVCLCVQETERVLILVT